MLICIPVYIKGQKALSLLWLSDLTEVGSPMISRVNNDVTFGLTTELWEVCHWCCHLVEEMAGA